MKKIVPLAVTIIFVFCIAPIAITQAMPRQVQINENVVYDQLNEFKPVFNQERLLETMMTENNTSKNLYAESDENPYIKRQINPKYIKRKGHGRSKTRDKDAAKDDGDVVDNGDADNDEDDSNNRDFGDESAIKFNKDLKNDSGYNEDL